LAVSLNDRKSIHLAQFPLESEDFIKYKRTVIVIAAAIIAFVSLASIFGISVGSDDDSFNIIVINNTPNTVTVANCTVDSNVCAPFQGSFSLKPGDFAQENENSDGVFRPSEVLATNGVVVGCLPFQYSSTPRSTLQVEITASVPCGNSLGAADSKGKDWPT
jgi:hypothetical protein